MAPGEDVMDVGHVDPAALLEYLRHQYDVCYCCGGNPLGSNSDPKRTCHCVLEEPQEACGKCYTHCPHWDGVNPDASFHTEAETTLKGS